MRGRRKNRNAQRAANYAQTRVNATNGRQPWLKPEDRAILTRTWQGATGLTDRELSSILGRSVQSIQVRRSRIR